jgi:hypothetical protein
MKRAFLSFFLVALFSQLLFSQAIETTRSNELKLSFVRLNGTISAYTNDRYRDAVHLHQLYPIGRFSPTIAFARPNSNSWLELNVLAFSTNASKYRNDTMTTLLSGTTPRVTGNVGTMREQLHTAFSIGKAKVLRRELAGMPLLFTIGGVCEYSRFQFTSQLPIPDNYQGFTVLTGGYSSYGIRVFEKGRFFADLSTRAYLTIGMDKTDAHTIFDIDMDFDIPMLQVGYHFLDTAND